MVVRSRSLLKSGPIKSLWVKPCLMLAVLALAACFGPSPPSSADIKDAEQSFLEKFFGANVTLVVENISDVNCSTATPSPVLQDQVKGKPFFSCGFTSTIYNRMTNTRETAPGNKPALLAKLDDKWHLVINDAIY